jgi:hypothetical protein
MHFTHTCIRVFVWLSEYTKAISLNRINKWNVFVLEKQWIFCVVKAYF